MFQRKDLGGGDRLYILEMWIEGRDTPLYKLGKASGHSSKKRMLDICGSYFDRYRETPVIRIKKDKVVTDVFAKETALHHHFANKRFVSQYKFSGCTEVFDITFEEALEKYEEVINDEDKEKIKPESQESAECGGSESVEGS